MNKIKKHYGIKIERLNSMIGYSPISLRAFREAAKHKSFTLAAETLGVTQSAISHHIKILESQVHIPLFYRHGRRLDLTAEGRELYDVTETAFNQIENVLSKMQRGASNKRLIITAKTGFTSQWLLPRLGMFYKKFVDEEIVVRSVSHEISLDREHAGLFVILSKTPPSPASIGSTLLWQEQLLAVCSTQYKKINSSKLDKVHDLKNHVLLHNESETAAEQGFDWESWLSHFNLGYIAYESQGRFFSHSDLVLQSTVEGYGVGLLPHSIAAKEIERKKLINLFPLSKVTTKIGCYLCANKEQWNEDYLSSLKNWIIEEAKLFNQTQ